MRRDHIASIDINRQFSLQVQIKQTLVNPLVEFGIARDAGIKDTAHAHRYGIINPPLKRRVNLLIGQIHGAVEHDWNFRRPFKYISGDMSILADIVAQARHGIRGVVRNAVPLKDLAVHPDAVSLRFLNLKLAIGTECIEIFFCDFFPLVQVLSVEQESVTFLAGVLCNIVGHTVQKPLLAPAQNLFADLRIFESDGQGHVHMAVDDAGHDELAAQVRHLAFVGLQAGFIAHIDEFAVLDGQGRGKGTLAVRREDFCVFDDFVCFHGCISLFCSPYA